MLTKDRQANILSISVGSLARSHTVPIVEKFVERAKAVRESTQAVRESTPGYRPYRIAKTAVKMSVKRELVHFFPSQERFYLVYLAPGKKYIKYCTTKPCCFLLLS